MHNDQNGQNKNNDRSSINSDKDIDQMKGLTAVQRALMKEEMNSAGPTHNQALNESADIRDEQLKHFQSQYYNVLSLLLETLNDIIEVAPNVCSNESAGGLGPQVIQEQWEA